jgi:hypothetical protein
MQMETMIRIYGAPQRVNSGSMRLPRKFCELSSSRSPGAACLAAVPVPLTRQSIFTKFAQLKQDQAQFNGHQLARSGAHWFGPPELVSRLSPDVRLLALQSWTGVSSSPKIDMFIDVFNTANGEKLLVIEGTYRGPDYPEAYFGISAWLAVDHFSVAPNETGDFEAELADRCAHAVDSRIVFSGIAGILDEPFNRPRLDILRSRMREHTRTFQE